MKSSKYRNQSKDVMGVVVVVHLSILLKTREDDSSCPSSSSVLDPPFEKDSRLESVESVDGIRM
jgi:hypothetical protein